MTSMRLKFILSDPFEYLGQIENDRFDGELSYAYTEGERHYLVVAIDFKLLEGRSRFAVVRNRHADRRQMLDYLQLPGCGPISAAITCYPVGHPAEPLLSSGDKEVLRDFDTDYGKMSEISKGSVYFIGTVEPLLERANSETLRNE